MKIDELTMPFNEMPIDLHNLYHLIDRHPLTIDPDSYVIDAIRLMNQQGNSSPSISLNSPEIYSNKNYKQTSYVLVVEAGNLLGIFTERDLVRLAASKFDLSDLKISEVMTQPLITMKMSDFLDIFTALSLLHQHQIRHLPILNDREQLIGIVSAASLLQGLNQLETFCCLQSLRKPQQIEFLRYPSRNPFQELEHHDEFLGFRKVWQRDIVEVQQSKQALQQSEQLYRQLVELQNEVILRVDNLGRLTFVNSVACKIFGKPMDELIGQLIFEWMFPEDEIPQAKEYFQALKSPPYQISISEQPVLTPGGIRWFQWNIIGIENTIGEVVEFQGVGRDITERRQAEESLRQSEARLNLALEAANMGIWDWYLLTNETIWSANMGSLYGLPSTTLCPSPEDFLQLVHPQDRENFSQSVKNSIEQGMPFTIEYRTVWKDGSIHWLNSRGQVYYDKAGKPIRMIGTTRDISERKQAEASLREREELYRSVVTAMSEGIVLLHTDGQIIACNASAERILGLSREQILQRTCVDARWLTIHEDGSPFPYEQHPAMETLRTGKPCSNVVMGVHKPDGQISWISINSQPLCREHETVPYAVVTSFADISEQQAALRLRQQAEQKIREQAALLDIATDAIFVKDLHDNILFWNPGAERLYGWSQQEAIGRNAQELLYSETSLHLHEAALNVVMELGLWQGELQKLTKSGKEVIVESRWTLMRDATGQPKSILVVDSDITQKKQLEEQFFRAQRLESLGTLAGGIAHDLNNILTPILAASQLLKVRFPDEQGRTSTVGSTSFQHLLEIVESNARRGAGLVKQVLSFARGFKGERTIVQLKHLITDIILIGKQTFPKSIEFTSSFPEELWAVCGDVTQLHQVLMNLVVNARDAMPNGGNIQVTAENILIDETYASMILEAQVGNYIRLTVTDTGAGMSPEILNRIFEPFFTTKDVGVGTGLGLSTVLGIIKSHGGFVKVSSKVGQGSQFKVFLPAIPATPDLTIEEIETPSGNGELILVVDDEAPICEIAKMILEKFNYRILTACNGIEAIALYAQHKHRISAVLMDMMMPEMDGITAIRTLKKMNSKVRIIASSGINCTETVAQAVMIGVQQVLPKPFTAKELLNSLHHVLRG
ncbi:PAS domain S-box protein [Nostoc parmelioides]|uniref:histidine kinase n=1 Tax=Nostoc parmelioides FACHB-3921 TaxID=2692909 RepID=A0ABR8B9R2_9NOSO|nr:PAS domain S-box protein [Nostoc parmelioides]MBD2250700.1 PAS domain S-box protein [Nostoc parmelioides FACHB-3921]